MSSLTSFTLFELLPTELRLEIWRQSCHRRVVEICYDLDNDCCTTTASVPAVLHTCHESRSEGLRVYRKSFGTKSHEPRIYFCREIDTLYIPRPQSDLGYDDSARSFTELIRDADCIVNLAIDYVDPSTRRPWETYNKYILMQSFPQVHEVSLVTNTEVPPDEGNGTGELDLTDPTRDASSLLQLLERVKMSFYYEVGGQLRMAGKEETKEPLHLPPFVLKSKTWKHRHEEKGPVGHICAA